MVLWEGHKVELLGKLVKAWFYPLLVVTLASYFGLSVILFYEEYELGIYFTPVFFELLYDIVWDESPKYPGKLPFGASLII